jgi:hypothetical protein
VAKYQGALLEVLEKAAFCLIAAKGDVSIVHVSDQPAQDLAKDLQVRPPEGKICSKRNFVPPFSFNIERVSAKYSINPLSPQAVSCHFPVATHNP